MSRPAFVSLTPIVEEDTWDGLAVAWSSDGTAFDSNLALVVMEFKNPDDTVAQTLSSATGDIVIDDANAWEITIPEIVLTLTVGVWKWTITTTDAAGIIKTRLIGVLPILDK